MSEIQEAELVTSEPNENRELDSAIEYYHKVMENDESGLTEEEIEKKEQEIINREIIENIKEHEPREIPCDKKVTVGPPTLTRFEKARIMGARALQLSLGAPTFIPIPDTARISLDIAMEELEQRIIPITIRRVLPNGDYQNIPISYFEK